MNSYQRHRYYSRHREILQNIAAHFNEKKAISESSAIEMSALDWAELGVNFDVTRLKYIKKTDSGKYWIDIMKLEETQVKTNKIQKTILILLSIFFGFIVLSMLGMIATLFGGFIAAVIAVLSGK
ncbi:MAG: hypothetical protein Fur003_1620 [Candidatus Dojkabacteria bacterium]